MGAAAAFRDPAALEETLFAPLRRQRSVRGAWVEPEDPGRGALSLGPLPEPPGAGPWVHIHDDMLGPISVRLAKLSDPRRRGRRAPAAGVPCVLIRQGGAGRSGEGVVVTVAYRIDDGAGDRGP